MQSAHPFLTLNKLNIDLSPRAPLAFFPDPTHPHRSHLTPPEAPPSQKLIPSSLPKSPQVLRFIRYARKHSTLLGSPTLYFVSIWIQVSPPSAPPQFFPLILEPLEIESASHDKQLALVSPHPLENPSYNPLLPHILSTSSPLPPLESLDLNENLTSTFQPLLPQNTSALFLPRIICIPPQSHNIYHDVTSHPDPLSHPLVHAIWNHHPQGPSHHTPPPPLDVNWASFYQHHAVTNLLDPPQTQIISHLTPLTCPVATISGPPGTGKSHTIVSLITSKLAQGQRILFISQKQPALDVILQRLHKLDLHHYALPLHAPQQTTHLKTALAQFQTPKKYPPVLIKKLLASFSDLQANIPKSSDNAPQTWEYISHLSPVLNALLALPSSCTPAIPLSDNPWHFPPPIPPSPSLNPLPPLHIPLREIFNIPHHLRRLPPQIASALQTRTDPLPQNLALMIQKAHENQLETLLQLTQTPPANSEWFKDALFILQENPDESLLSVPTPQTLIDQLVCTTLQNPPVPHALKKILPEWTHLYKICQSDNLWISNNYLAPLSEDADPPPLHIYNQIINLPDTLTVFHENSAEPLSHALFRLSTFVHNLNVVPLHAFDCFFPPHVPVSYHPKLLLPLASTISWLKQKPPIPDPNPALIRHAHLWSALEPLLHSYNLLVQEQTRLEKHFNLNQDEATTQQIIHTYHSLLKHNSTTLNKMLKFFKPSWWSHISLYSKIALAPSPKNPQHFSAHQETMLLRLGKFLENALAFIDAFSAPHLEPIHSQFEPTDLPTLVPSLQWLDAAPPFLKSSATPNVPVNPLLPHLLSQHGTLSQINPHPLLALHQCLQDASPIIPPTCLDSASKKIHIYQSTLAQMFLIADLSQSSSSPLDLRPLPLSNVLSALSVFNNRNSSFKNISHLLEQAHLPPALAHTAFFINPLLFKPVLDFLSSISNHVQHLDQQSLPHSPLLIQLVHHLASLEPHCPSLIALLSDGPHPTSPMMHHSILEAFAAAAHTAQSLETPNPSNPWAQLPLDIAINLAPHLHFLHSHPQPDPLQPQDLEATLGALSSAHEILLSNRHHEINHTLASRIHSALDLNPQYPLLLNAIRLYTKPALSDAFASKKQAPSLPSSTTAFFHQYPHFIQALKPLIMASPSTLPKLLPHQAFQFDCLIIDEASQLPASHALHALLRAKQIIVVGDTHQLQPPNPSPLNPSILQLLLDIPHIPHFRLTWHYRSKHPELIHTSNRLCYQNQLSPIPSPFQKHDPLSSNSPSPSKPLGTHTLFVRGNLSDSRNIPEAQAVVDTACSLIRLFPDLSLGIIATTDAQAHFIENLLDTARASSLPVRNYFASKKASSAPLFVKTIDEVQGDERDIILISITYSPHSSSPSLPKNLGHLSGPLHLNYLNVALSRSAFATYIIHSIPPHTPPKSPEHQTLLNIISFHNNPKFTQASHSTPLPLDTFAKAAFSCASAASHPLTSSKLKASDPLGSHSIHISTALIGRPDSPSAPPKHTPVLLDTFHLHAFHHLPAPLLCTAGWNKPLTPHDAQTLHTLLSATRAATHPSFTPIPPP